ncbi:hypothetical protein KQX54_000335, partial [Cotesia glomerata]
ISDTLPEKIRKKEMPNSPNATDSEPDIYLDDTRNRNGTRKAPKIMREKRLNAAVSKNVDASNSKDATQDKVENLTPLKKVKRKMPKSRNMTDFESDYYLDNTSKRDYTRKKILSAPKIVREKRLNTAISKNVDASNSKDATPKKDENLTPLKKVKRKMPKSPRMTDSDPDNYLDDTPKRDDTRK